MQDKESRRFLDNLLNSKLATLLSWEALQRCGSLQTPAGGVFYDVWFFCVAEFDRYLSPQLEPGTTLPGFLYAHKKSHALISGKRGFGSFMWVLSKEPTNSIEATLVDLHEKSHTKAWGSNIRRPWCGY